MAELKKSMVKASTLLEVIIAMVIILIVFSLAIGIYNHVLAYTPTVKYEQVKTICDGVISQSVNEENWSDQDLVQDSVMLKKTVLPYEKYTDLVLITVKVYQQDKEIGESRSIVRKTGHE